MTFREMVNGFLNTYPREQQVRHDRSVTLKDLVAKIPARYLRFYDTYDHTQGDPKPQYLTKHPRLAVSAA